MSDNERLLDLVAMLCEAFNRTPTKATFAAYEIGLADMPVDEIESAVLTAIRESKFMPTVSELRRAGDTGTTANPEDLATNAFAIVDRAVQSVGGYKSPGFSDPLINATIRALGGWNSICEKPESEFLSFFRAAFIKTYAAYARIGVGDDQAAPLIGIHDQKNGLLGHESNNEVDVICAVGYSREVVVRHPPTTYVRVKRKPLIEAKPPRVEIPVDLKPPPSEEPPADQAARVAEVNRVLGITFEAATR